MFENLNSHVALVPKSSPVILDESDGSVDGDSRTSHEHAFLTSIYEHYAALYPSTALILEYQQRDSLIRALAASDDAQRQQQLVSANEAKKKTARGGFLRQLFGRFTNDSPIDLNKHQGLSKSLEDRLQYSDIFYSTSMSLPDYTHSSLDASAIPSEAHSVVRFHLSSYHRTHVTARTSSEPTSTSSLWIIIGLGQLIELDCNHAGSLVESEFSNLESHQSIVHRTSDHDDLIPDKSLFRIEYTRAALIGPNFLMVSWGYVNIRNNVVLYRRMAPLLNKKSNADVKTEHGVVVSWQVVGWMGPSSTVQQLHSENDDAYLPSSEDNDILHGSSEVGGTFGSQLLNITDVVPITVPFPQPLELPSSNVYTSQSQQSAVVAISRLGGYIEFITLPPSLCFGPILEQQRTTQKKKNKSANRKGHYLVEFPNFIKSIHPSWICALSTSDYHNDVIGLESLCVRHLIDNKRYHGGADHIIVAHGGRINGDNLNETLSFWSVHVQFDPNIPEVGFHVRVEIVEALDLTGGSNSQLLLGPSQTIFATEKILQYWRKPRNVQLKATDVVSEEVEFEGAVDSTIRSGQSKSPTRAATISIPVPITAVRFASSNLRTVESLNEQDACVRAAILDTNGGATILNCDLLVRYVTNTLKDDDRDALGLQQEETNCGIEGSYDMVPLVQVIFNRSQIMQRLQQSLYIDQSNGLAEKRRRSAGSTLEIPRIGDLHWLKVKKSSSSAGFRLVALVQDGSGLGSCVRVLMDDFGVRTMSLDMSVAYCMNASRDNKTLNGKFHRFSYQDALYLSLEHSMDLTSATGTNKRNRNGTRRATKLLQLCAVQEMDLRDIVKSLLLARKYKEAIAVYEKHLDLSSIVNDNELSCVIDACKRKLWETRQDLQDLQSVTDDSFVIDQVLSIFTISAGNGSSNQPSFHPIVEHNNFSTFRSVCELALRRTSQAALSDGTIERIRNCFIRLGTYLILCNYFATAPNLLYFVRDFMSLDISELAISFARQSLIIPLSMLYYRHRLDTIGNLDVLDAIPLSMSPRKYQHLLPIDKNEQNRMFFMIGCKRRGKDFTEPTLFEYEKFPAYLQQRFEFNVILDEKDQLNVSIAEKETRLNGHRVSLHDWYFTRLKRIESFVNSVDLCYEFSILAKRALQDDETHDPFFAYRLTKILRTMYDDEMLMGKLVSFKALPSITIEKFNHLDAKNLIEFVFDSSVGVVDFGVRYSRYLLPLSDLKSSILGENIEQKIASSMLSYCIDSLNDLVCKSDSIESRKRIVNMLENCWTIAHRSRTSLNKSERIIKRIPDVINFVVSVIEIIQHSSFNRMYPTAMDDCSLYLDVLWRMYETLPESQPLDNAIENKDEIYTIQAKMDRTCNNLIRYDIVSKYPSTFEGIPVKYADWQDSSLKSEYLISYMCDNVCLQVEHNRNRLDIEKEKSDLLRNLISDIKIIYRLDDKDRMSVECLKAIFVDHLVKPLLQKHQIKIIAEFLSAADPEACDLERISEEVVLFFNDVMHASQGAGGLDDSLRHAMDCQGVLEKFLPNLRQELQTVRHLADASHFINEVLFPTEKYKQILLADMLEQSPLDIIGCVLTQKPDLKLQKWADTSWAANANASIRARLCFETKRGSDHLPLASEANDALDLPGQEVLQLAQFLGLQTTEAMMLVKAMLADYLLNENHYGAAAAMSRSLLADILATKTKLGSEFDLCARLVSCPKYEDIETKREFCKYFLSVNSERIVVANLASYDLILKASNLLENERLIRRARKNSPFGGIGKFFHDTKAEYGVDLGNLFTSLQSQSFSCVVDSKLIATLFRYCIFWCIARTTRQSMQPIGAIERLETQFLFCIAACLMLFIREQKQLKEGWNEAKAIFENEKTKALGSFPRTKVIQPNPEIIRRLQNRGYSVECARKAVVKSNNVGFNEALQWAVAHSLDSDFNTPLVTILTTSHRFLDYYTLEVLSRAFSFIDDILDCHHTLASFLTTIGLQQPISPKPSQRITFVESRGQDELQDEVPINTIYEKPDTSENMTNTVIANDSYNYQGTRHETDDESKDVRSGTDSTYKLVILTSSLALNRMVTSLQERAYTTLKAQKIEFEIVDAADRNLRELRDELVTKSGLRGKYPQFFLVDLLNGEATFWGDWDRFEQVNDEGALVTELGGRRVTATLVGKTSSESSVKDSEPAKLKSSLDYVEETSQGNDVLNVQLSNSKINHGLGLSNSNGKSTMTDTHTSSVLIETPMDYIANGSTLPIGNSESGSPDIQNLQSGFFMKSPSVPSSFVQTNNYFTSETPLRRDIDSPDRLALLKAGQQAFARLRQSSSPSAEERQKLIAEGRRLFQRSRLSTQPIAASSPQSSAYNIATPNHDTARIATVVDSTAIQKTESVHYAEQAFTPSVQVQAEAEVRGWEFDEDDDELSL